MHVSGHLMQDRIKEEIKDHISVIYLRPQGRIDTEDR
jgi:hypothetical protein